jgi:hypothetical protein
MSQLMKVVFVPRWLDRVAKEVGICNDDLISIEKLSCILSKRDIELYQMANFNMRDCLIKVSGNGEKKVASILNDLMCALEILPLEKRAAYANVDTDAFIYGATSTKNGEVQGARHGITAEIGPEDTLLIRVTVAPVEGPNQTCLATVIAEKLHAMMDFSEFVTTGAFKQYVRELQIN